MFKKNELEVLRAVRSSEGLTFTELLGVCGLPRSSTHMALRELVRYGIIDETVVGPRRSVFRLAPEQVLRQAEERWFSEFRGAVFGGFADTKPKLVFTDAYRMSDASIRQLRRRFEVVTFSHSPSYLSDELFLSRSVDADVVVRFDAPTINDEVLEQLPKLKAIVCPTCNIYNIDFDACTRHNVRVTYLDPVGQRYFTDNQTEYVINALLTLRNPLVRAAEAVRTAGGFRPEPGAGRDLKGARVGLVFSNADVTKTIAVLRAFGCEVSASNVLEEPRSAMSFGLPGYTSLDHLWDWSDVAVFFGGSDFDLDRLLVAPKMPEQLVILTEKIHYDPNLLREQILSQRITGVVLDALPSMFEERAFDSHPQNALRSIINLPNVYVTPETSVLSGSSMQNNEKYVLSILLNLVGID